MSSELVASPKFGDEATDLIYPYACNHVADLKSKGITVIELLGANATRANLEKEVKNLPRPSVIDLRGHGNPKVIALQDNKIGVDENNVTLFKGHFVHAFSCSVAKGDGSLGSKFWAFDGWKEDIVVPGSETGVKPFMDAQATYCEAMHKGMTHGEAGKILEERIREAIKNAGMMSQWMLQDYLENHVTLGALNERLETGPSITVVEVKIGDAAFNAEKTGGEWGFSIPKDFPLGKVTLTVRAQSDNGVWSDPVTVEIEILPAYKPKVEIVNPTPDKLEVKQGDSIIIKVT